MSGHRYPDPDGTSDCAYSCGCYMGPFCSGGPEGIDPFGECPKAPPPSELPMAEEHRWNADGEEFRATGKAAWYREGEDWRRADPDYIARFLRHELLRLVAERDALRDSIYRLAQEMATEDPSPNITEALVVLAKGGPDRLSREDWVGVAGICWTATLREFARRTRGEQA
jgi:hypothetical protein